MSTMLAIRSVHVIQAFVCILASRSSYRRPRLAAAAAIASMAELGWMAQRDLSNREHSASTARVDGAFCAIGLAVLGSATYPADRTSSINWMMPLSVGGCLGAAVALDPLEGWSVLSSLGTVYASTTWGSITARSASTASAVANTVSFPAFFGVASFVVRLVRNLAQNVDDARHEAVEMSARSAAQAAKMHEQRILHDSALQTLEAIAQLDLDLVDIRLHARREADRLRKAIAGDAAANGLLSGLEELAAEFGSRGLRVELVAVELDYEPSLVTSAALCDATREALSNALKHSGGSSVVVRAICGPDGVEVTVRDHGVGFDPLDSKRGYGIDNSVVGRMKEIGGSADITSEPGRGTKVSLWAPR